ncbi:DUF58 domain-containing protein [Sulfurovum sp. zt1-1]|uniref:DUF58 domain-containing protein n=1 Tax=Sulfurovum zhangzhouensis TaxID=3019067 RepID=A0ABT7QUZ5_9BACT|nr:DUF58 domain-containing protein [Sulfurovum zhangzhouensis]MDM5270653.1 DUF58 domain-containing protein [Sulfurovum zhangzhouensis]
MSLALKTLQLKARYQVYTLLAGNNLSKMHGEGYDFSELREYQIGDDVRKINWTITAKLGRPYIKELHANRELSVVVAAMMDGSLYFGADNLKQHAVTEIATILGYSAHHNNDLFTGFNFYSDKYTLAPPTKQLYHIENYSKELYEQKILHTALDYTKAIQTLSTHIHKRSLLFIIGDFLEPVDLSLLAQKHEVIAIIVRHREEEKPHKLGDVILDNPKSTQSLNTDFSTTSIQHYLAKLKAHDETVQTHFIHYNIRHTKIYTDEDPIDKLVRLFV